MLAGGTSADGASWAKGLFPHCMTMFKVFYSDHSCALSLYVFVPFLIDPNVANYDNDKNVQDNFFILHKIA